MKRASLLIGALAILTLAGCNMGQADKTGKQIETGTGQAVQTAKKDLAESGDTLRVKTALMSSTELKNSDIHVSSDKQVVHLTGTVISETQKQVAERIVHDTVGASMKVDSQLKIEKRAAQAH